MYIFEKGFNFNQDGPGNRLVLHLQGCNMHCIWCANPEGMGREGGTFYTEDEVFELCKKCRLLFFAGGGVTFTGGEATMQPKELTAVLKQLQKAGIHTAVETNGTSPQLSEMLPFIDYLIMDYKHYDGETLYAYTGADIRVIEQNFEYIADLGRQMHIRIPLINNINTENPEGFTDFFTKHNTENIVFEFLPYHEFGKEKWTTPYKVQDGFISKETLKKFVTIFTEHHLKVVTT